MVPHETSPATSELRDLLRYGTDDQHDRFAKLFSAEVFDHVEGRSPAENAALAYRRLRHVNAELGPAAELVTGDLERFLVLHEWAGVLDPTLVSVLTIHYNLCLGAILELGGGERPELAAVVGELSRMDSVGVFLATELGYGNNVAEMRTRAVYDRATDEFVLTTPSHEARKFMPNTGLDGVPKIAVVLARLELDGQDEGVFPFVVRIRDENGPLPGVDIQSLGDKPGLALDNAVTTFRGVRVPRALLLDAQEPVIGQDGARTGAAKSLRRRFNRAMTRVQTGKLCLTSATAAAARASLFIAVRHAFARHVTVSGGRSVPVMTFRTHQAQLLDALARTCAVSVLLNSTRRQAAEGPFASVGVKRALAITKALVTWTAQDVVTTCIERCGARGMFTHNRISPHVALVQGSVTAEGDNQVVLLDAANEMLLGRDYTPPPAVTGDGSIDDPEHLLRLFSHRERRIFEKARAARGDGADPFERANSAALLSAELGRVHGVRRTLEEFHAVSLRATSPEARTVLTALLLRFGLAELGRDAAWHLEEGSLTSAQTRGIPAAITRLDALLVPEAETVVAAFGFTNEVLRAPIAENDYVRAYAELLPVPGLPLI
ncbi:Acyl-coenzyme A oxidase [Lentzea fradiae]|uniref:Acyl-coenzyme A oxidase n=1 Tax=Lentzea fradiae TaxID=200378 RepID=A0A1G8CN93_9PSEU|nr:acyl-CoA dehydrogenase [Lentzea fradiae]SDH46844.1 Acyl-coenzyme A oxidase [Lentzea fradiae]